MHLSNQLIESPRRWQTHISNLTALEPKGFLPVTASQSSVSSRLLSSADGSPLFRPKAQVTLNASFLHPRCPVNQHLCLLYILNLSGIPLLLTASLAWYRGPSLRARLSVVSSLLTGPLLLPFSHPRSLHFTQQLERFFETLSLIDSHFFVQHFTGSRFYS